MLKSIALAAFLVLPIDAAQADDRAPVCRGELPFDTAEIRGPVLHVLDGARLCVALGPHPTQWVPVRLADAPSELETARGALMAASFGQDAICRVVERDDAGAVAVCRTRQGSIGPRLATPKVIRTGQTWR